MATTINPTATATQNTAPTPAENKKSFFMRCVTSIKNCCCKPETITVAGAVTVAVGAALVIGGVVATGGAVAAVGLAVGIAGIVMSALTNKTKGDAAPSSAETPDVHPRETGYQGGTAQLVFDDSPEPERPRGLEPTISYTLDDMEDDILTVTVEVGGIKYTDV